MWRVALCQLKLNREKFGRPIVSLIEEPGLVDYLITFDGSLTGAGFYIQKSYEENPIAYGIIDYIEAFEEQLPNSSYQNTSELIAVTAAMFYLLVMESKSPAIIHIRGDSETALAWTLKEAFTGDNGKRASIALTLIRSKMKFAVREATWISSEDNHWADDLSRGIIPPIFTMTRSWRPSSDRIGREFLQLVNPLLASRGPMDVFTIYTKFDNLVERIHGENWDPVTSRSRI
jgi:hypothetical protein